MNVRVTTPRERGKHFDAASALRPTRMRTIFDISARQPARAAAFVAPGPIAPDALDRAARQLAANGARVITVWASTEQSLALPDLITALVQQAPPGKAAAHRLELAFDTLTEAGPGFSAVVLLVANAEMLALAPLHYLQLAARSSEQLRLVLLGDSGVTGALAGPGLAWLRERIEVQPLQPSTPPAVTPAPRPAGRGQIRHWAPVAASVAVALCVLLPHPAAAP